jgi:xylulokinase
VTASNFTAANLVRAIIEGASFGLLNGLDLILDREQVRRIVLIGGGARSAGWRQLLADASGVDIHVPVEEESGCLGAAMQAQFAWSFRNGSPRSFADISSRCVRLDETRTAVANAGLRGQYDEARAAYNRELETVVLP